MIEVYTSVYFSDSGLITIVSCKEEIFRFTFWSAALKSFVEQVSSEVWPEREEGWGLMDFVFSMSSWGCFSYISAGYFCSFVICYFLQSASITVLK